MAEPSKQVATKVLFENDRVRVWDMTLKPGEASKHHLHENDYLFVYLAKSTLTLFAEGKNPETSTNGPLFVEYREVGPGIVHHVRNDGDADHREILVELKGGSRSKKPREPETSDD